VGAGRSDLAHALFGINEPLGGRIILDGDELEIHRPLDAIRSGIGLVPEDRKQHGLILEMTIEANLTLPSLDRHQTMKMIQFEENRSIADNMVKKLDIRLRDTSDAAESLSGGNQQKVVLGKWLSLNPKFLILDEPTRGIDVVAKEEIYRLMEKLSSQGVATMVISSEMQEVLGIADRILVMHEGKISGELTSEAFSEKTIMNYATGGK
jgi:ribose transport system ATP-binding protein